MNKPINLKKITALMLCFCLIAISLFSIAFIVKEANHHCTGEHCPICIEIQQAVIILRQLGTALIIIIWACLLLETILVKCLISVNVRVLSPVLLKVRMNN